MFYIYILLLNNGEIYKGITIDLKRRVEEHKLGKVKSTRDKRPVKLIHYEAYLLKDDAMRREKYLKTNEGRKLLRRQISSLLHKLKLYDRFVRG